jgi:uncharacterized protein DUF6065
MSVIQFHAIDEVQQNYPRPYPAAKAVPEWLRQMPLMVDEKLATVKRCPPFLEAMTAGYIIPLAGDLAVRRDETGEIKFASDLPLMQQHPRSQYATSPFGKWPIVKFMNPWVVVTEPGYSTLFVAPFNRWEIPFMPLNGIVETDTYYNHINFPSVCTLSVGGSCMLAKGTPIIQAIPFRRDEWSSEFKPLDVARIDQTRAMLIDDQHAYKQKHWIKHEYT